MNILLVGSGGREHALAWKIAQSPLLSRLVCAPGNPGMASLGELRAVKATDVEGLVALAHQIAADLVVVGPESAIEAGLAVLGPPLVVDAKTGASGAGRPPSAATHHSAVNDAVAPHDVGPHRHPPETAPAARHDPPPPARRPRRAPPRRTTRLISGRSRVCPVRALAVEAQERAPCRTGSARLRLRPVPRRHRLDRGPLRGGRRALWGARGFDASVLAAPTRI